jgi:hypothetical protein
LSRLARASPLTKFIRVRATAIGFALKSASDTGALGPSSFKKTARAQGDQSLYVVGEETDFDDNDFDENEDAEADTDMLPTMLIYEKGELLHTWVRVDWEAGTDGIENLLLKYVILLLQLSPQTNEKSQTQSDCAEVTAGRAGNCRTV